MRRSAALAVALLLALAGVTAAAPTRPDSTTSAPTTITAVVSFVGDAGRAALRGVRVLSTFPELDSAFVSGTPEQVAALHGRPGVRSVVRDYALRPTGHNAEASKGVYSTERLSGGAGTADAGLGVTVAVLDTGISDTEALNRASGRLHDGLDASSDDSGFTDNFGHGTFMANIVAGGSAAGSDGRSLGVAPGATVVNVKVADSNGDTSLGQVLAGMSWVYAFRDRIDVVHFAFAGERPDSAYGPDPLTWAVEKLREGGLVVVVPSGNNSGELGDPGFDPYALTVGAADTRAGKAQVASFSGYGNVHGVSKPDVVATGVGVLSLLPPQSRIARDNPQSLQPSGLYRGSGTSQATAVTAGVAAMFLQDFPAATPGEVKSSLRTFARKVRGAGAGQGLLQVPPRLVAENGPRTGAGGGGTGEQALDEAAWHANTWLDGIWLEDMASSWRASSWRASSWRAGTWRGSEWDASSWRANSWRAGSWRANSWRASSWRARAWAAGPGTGEADVPQESSFTATTWNLGG